MKNQHIKEHKKINDLLTAGDIREYKSSMISHCAAPAKPNYGDLYLGSETCRQFNTKLCIEDASPVGCKYIKNNHPSNYEQSMFDMCFNGGGDENNKGKNINKAICKSYFKDNWNDSIQDNLKDFCRNEDKEDETSEPKERYKMSKYSNFCSCFKPDSFYDTLSKSIQKKWNGPPGMDQRPQCIYPPCLTTGLYDKGEKCQSISFTSCVQDVKIDAGGDIIVAGEINIDQDSVCETNFVMQENNDGTPTTPEQQKKQADELESARKRNEEYQRNKNDDPDSSDSDDPDSSDSDDPDSDDPDDPDDPDSDDPDEPDEPAPVDEDYTNIIILILIVVFFIGLISFIASRKGRTRRGSTDMYGGNGISGILGNLKNMLNGGDTLYKSQYM